MSAEQDKVFVRNFVAVIGGLFGLTIILIVFGIFIGGNGSRDEYRQELAAERAAENLQPVGKVRLSGEPQPIQAEQRAAPEAAEFDASATVASVCAGCHQAGVMNAPLLDDTAVWQARLDDKGMETLVDHAINGFNGMPAKGGATNLSDEQVRETVVYMLENAGVSAQQ